MNHGESLKVNMHMISSRTTDDSMTVICFGHFNLYNTRIVCQSFSHLCKKKKTLLLISAFERLQIYDMRFT
jgi:hypothetical protein